jgi:hypothetical protein
MPPQKTGAAPAVYHHAHMALRINSRSACDPKRPHSAIEDRVMTRFGVRALTAAVLASAAGPALAWGDDGHRIVGYIAYDLLTPAAKAKANALLAADTDTSLTAADFASRATWADKYRDMNGRKDHYAQTRNWHFTDLELSGPDLSSACFGFPLLAPDVPAADTRAPADDCATHKIEQFRAELADPATAQAERILAFKFLLHLLGDIHQPLHASDDHDQGGNCEKVQLAPGGPTTPLHSYWDTGAVDAGFVAFRKTKAHANATLQDYAAALRNGITKSEAKSWTQGGARDWTMESYQVAVAVAYQLPPHPACPPTGAPPNPPFALSPSYQKKAVATAKTQMQKAGVRLAAVLNQALS